MKTAKPTSTPQAPAHTPDHVPALRRYYAFFGVLAVVATLTIISNLALRRGPVHDAQAVSDIGSLQSSVDGYYLGHNQLPAALSDAHPAGDVTKRLSNYEYQRASANSYQLRATFLTSHTDNSKNYYPSSPVYPGGTGGNGEMPNPNNHIKGHQCFTYTVLPIMQPLPLKGAPTP
jgi:competence protein ComGC